MKNQQQFIFFDSSIAQQNICYITTYSIFYLTLWVRLRPVVELRCGDPDVQADGAGLRCDFMFNLSGDCILAKS